jgi:peptide/nickel transport system substrate-binding protein
MVVAGVGLLVMAQIAGAVGGSSSFTKGGIFRVGTTGASVQVDPQLAYITTAWWLEYATAAKLYNYPDKRGPVGSILVPEVASKYTVSPDGTKYTFFIRKGFRFSDGTPVTAKNFKYAINRVANRDLASPGAQFIIDPKGTNIVGAQAVNNGQGTDVSGVVVKGNRLIIHLTQPDGAFLSKITMPFFQATSTKLPLTTEVVNIDDITTIPSAGPYAYSRNEVNTLTSLRRNPFYRSGPGRTRPHNLSGLDVQWNLDEGQAFNQVMSGELDEGPLPATLLWEPGVRYGVNKTRFWVEPANCTGYLAMNLANNLFKGNANLRKAINYAISRKAYSDQAGPYAGEPWSHLLNPDIPGWRKEQPYPLKKPNLTKARRLATGHFRDGRITVYYRSSGTINPAQAQIVRQDLINLGFRPEDITMKGFSGGNIYTAMGLRGNDADIGVSMGWCSDYPDPAQSFGGALYYSQMNSPKWNARIAAAEELGGQKRYEAFGQLDLDIMRQFAPVAVERLYNNRYFFSDNVNPKSLVYQGIYQDWSIPALALK